MEQYKILGAMLALREFTVKDLANHTGVKEATIHTVLKREESLIERFDYKKTKKPGGQLGIYRIRPQRVDALISKLKRLHEQIPSIPLEKSNDIDVDIPLGLLVAEDAIEHEYESARNLDEKDQLLKTAEVDFKRGEREANLILASKRISREKAEAIKAALNKLSALLEMRKAEIALIRAHSDKPFDPGVRVVSHHIDKAALYLQSLPSINHDSRDIEALKREATELRREVCLIKGVEDDFELLTDHVSEVLRNYDIGVYFQKANWPNAVIECNRMDAYIIVLDSRQNQSQAMELCKSILDAGFVGGRATVLDIYSDDEIRNVVMGEYQAKYQPFARQLSPNSLVNCLELNILPEPSSTYAFGAKA